MFEKQIVACGSILAFCVLTQTLYQRVAEFELIPGRPRESKESFASRKDVESYLVMLQTPSYTNFFADSLVAEAKRDKRIVSIHAAMGGGTGLNRFEKEFPDRVFDVGIAEQVTFQ